MKICSNELTKEQYDKAREGLHSAREYSRHMVANYKAMQDQGHPVPDSVIATYQVHADAINVFFPGLDDVPAPPVEEEQEASENEPPPVPTV